VQSQHQQAQ